MHTAAISGETWYKIRGILYQSFCNLVTGWRLVPLDIAKITSRPCGVISSDPLADCREFTGTRGQWGHPLFSSHTYACTYKGRISWVIYSLAVHTYRYLLFGETFAQRRTVLSVILPVVRFFQKFRPDIILWEGRGKDDFPT